MQFHVRDNDDGCQPLPLHSSRIPRVVVQAHHGAPLLKWSGLVLRQLVERLGVATAVDSALHLLRRCHAQRTATTPSFRFLREAQPSQPRPALHGHPTPASNPHRRTVQFNQVFSTRPRCPRLPASVRCSRAQLG